jgi:hypothetical protein
MRTPGLTRANRGRPGTSSTREQGSRSSAGRRDSTDAVAVAGTGAISHGTHRAPGPAGRASSRHTWSYWRRPGAPAGGSVGGNAAGETSTRQSTGDVGSCGGTMNSARTGGAAGASGAGSTSSGGGVEIYRLAKLAHQSGLGIGKHLCVAPERSRSPHVRAPARSAPALAELFKIGCRAFPVVV